ncbi:MAG: hypothetical protein AUJ07_08645 [Crenarchaeota archaeon 13_1_40CM_3_53_5]|nr:MAG: hypothetical protein AUJ07_08645 [Crenarchaeota archaeon 13_1_40CM_3_53_5]
MPVRPTKVELEQETITDDSPLIRSEHSRVIEPITPGRVHDIVHDLYVKAGLLTETKAARYVLRTHSLRKYFKTQLISHGIPESYVDYMMGHVLDTYNDVQALGPEFLRNQYRQSGLSIRPRTMLANKDMAKKMLEALDVQPEELVSRDARAYPHRTFATPLEQDQHEYQLMMSALREAVKRDIAGGVKE